MPLDPLPSSLQFRRAKAEDRSALLVFDCCTDERPEFEVEVEHFVRERLLDGPPSVGTTNYRALILEHRGELIACAAHRLWLASVDWPAVELTVAAISKARQGARLASGEALIELVMSALITDALNTHGGELVTAVVHKENARSLNACGRSGLVQRMEEDTNYIRVGGRFAH